MGAWFDNVSVSLDHYLHRVLPMYINMFYVTVLDSIFFFSSRRRHTRYWRDWSSDVCSSDLDAVADMVDGERLGQRDHRALRRAVRGPVAEPDEPRHRRDVHDRPAAALDHPGDQIGRASCRERV